MNSKKFRWIIFCLVQISLLTVNATEIKDDETLVFFNTDAHFSVQAGEWLVPIHGWIYEPEVSTVRSSLIEKILAEKYQLEVTPENRRLFQRRLNLLLSDNERGKQVVIHLCGQKQRLAESAENGHFKITMQVSEKIVEQCQQQNKLAFYAEAKNGRQFKGDVRLLSETGMSVISDIDDTVKITQVTDKKQLIGNTFYKPFESIDGIADTYQQWQQKGISIHFVSSSPWQLYPELLAFMQRDNFPWTSFSLKSIRFKDSTLLNLFKPGDETKPLQIRSLTERFPKRQFVLVGDSGEQDPEVYGQLMREQPGVFIAAAIRNVGNEQKNSQRLNSAFENLDRDKVLLFTTAEELDEFVSLHLSLNRTRHQSLLKN